MELGQKIKEARLAAGRSQRQLCGDTITRDMLSQIENGTAKPSYTTLQALCARLGKPVSYFWEEAPSQNLGLLKKASEESPEDAIFTLAEYLSPDPVLEGWYRQLRCKVLLCLAGSALEQNRSEDAAQFLSQAETVLQEEYRLQFLILKSKLPGADAADLAAQLPDNTEELLLRAQAALQTGKTEQSLLLLECTDSRPEQWYALRGQVLLQKQEYPQAIACFMELEALSPRMAYPYLEICYRELGDFQKAYEYARKQLNEDRR